MKTSPVSTHPAPTSRRSARSKAPHRHRLDSDRALPVLPAAFDTAGAREYLGRVYTVAALVKRRERGLGPPFRRDETGRILYLRTDLDEFLRSLPKG